jgi:hypothetical protein
MPNVEREILIMSEAEIALLYRAPSLLSACPVLYAFQVS